MGFRIESYTREELSKIALPGRAVSTLFWVLPLGRWRPAELEQWWQHFTRKPGDCNALGLLLVRDLGAKAPENSKLSSNLGQSLANADGGNLLDLIPEARHHGYDVPTAKKSLLVLSGAFPQPGWGVLITVRRGIESPGMAEELIHRVIESSCSIPQLDAIRTAAGAYHEREEARTNFPQPPRRPPELNDLKVALEQLSGFFSSIETAGSKELESALAGARNAIDRHLVDGKPNDSFWQDIQGRIRLIRDLNVALDQTDANLPDLWDAYQQIAAEEQKTHVEALEPRQAAWLRKIRFLMGFWPNLDLHKLGDFLATTFRADLLTLIEPTISSARNALESQLKEVAGDYEVRMERYRVHEAGRIERLKAAEGAFRIALEAASLAQWELGPAFLMSLEQECTKSSIQARSVTWDPARMIGWKLHVSQPGIQPKHLVMAANSVLETNIAESGISPPGGGFSGSLFADYVYYVSISAKRLSPWLATRNLLLKLLNVAQLDDLTGSSPDSSLFPQGTEKDLAEQLLCKWGWAQPREDATRPLAACLNTRDSTAVTLLTSPNDTRISFEGYLKDLCRVTISSLGWRESEMEQNLTVHCATYRWSTRGGWGEESANLTAGGALVLLEDLVPLAFPGQFTVSGANELWKTCRTLLDELNRGSHHPPPPPPTAEQMRGYAQSITSIRRTVDSIIGEMPWHLKATQTFGTEPMIVTGHAWSHSHPEERLIRVIISSSSRQDEDLLVWNRNLTNPVMTDAIVV